MGLTLATRSSNCEQYNRVVDCFAEMMMVHCLNGEMLSKVIDTLGKAKSTD
jgi:hypothetical protein